MGFATEQVWRSKTTTKRIIRPYGDMAQSSLLPTLYDVQSSFEFRGEKGRGALPRYKIERKLDAEVPVVFSDGTRGKTRWAPVGFRPDSLDAAVNYAASGPYRVLERTWDGQYVPLGTAEVLRVLKVTQPNAPSPTKTAKPTSGFKGKRAFW